MTKLHQVYKCEVCGNIVQVVHASVGTLVCCDQPMTLQEEHTKDKGKEKHVPIIEKRGTGILVKVGDIPHPMEEKHYIEWIEVIANGTLYKKYLHPSEKPEAVFPVKKEDVETVREYCNLHGLWKA